MTKNIMKTVTWFHTQPVSMGIAGNQALAVKARLNTKLCEFVDPLE
jgi:hypothetical protein